MKSSTATVLIAFFGLAAAAPASVLRREVPQEHSHEKFITSVRASLALNNPAGIADPVFGLLGSAAAASGAGKITNVDCLHQATADQAFTNAKAAKNVQGMSDALLYAALERNTGKVGLASVACTEKAANPEIAAVSQHQDPASPGAAAANKAVTLSLAKQLASIGADPQLALQSGTFAPGSLADGTGKGKTCDVLTDPQGCIFTQNLLVNDATAAEIAVAAGGAAPGAAAPVGAKPAAAKPAASKPAASKSGKGKAAAVGTGVASPAASCPAASTVTVNAPAATATAGAAAVPAVPTAAAAATPTTGTNVQTFTGTLGGAAPPVQSSAGARPFSVNGNTFVNVGAAKQRSCAIQQNACANAVNSGKLAGSTVGDCTTQETACNAA